MASIEITLILIDDEKSERVLAEKYIEVRPKDTQESAHKLICKAFDKPSDHEFRLFKKRTSETRGTRTILVSPEVNFIEDQCYYIVFETDFKLPLLSTSPLLNSAIRVANLFLGTSTCRALLSDVFDFSKELAKRMSTVRVEFQESCAEPGRPHKMAWIDNNKSATDTIWINQKFLDRYANMDPNNIDELSVLVVGLGCIIVHQVSHVLNRWKFNDSETRTPDRFNGEVGIYTERQLFGNVLCMLIEQGEAGKEDSESWDSSMPFTGIAVDVCSCVNGCSCRTRYMQVYKTWIDLVYNCSTSDAPDTKLLCPAHQTLPAPYDRESHLPPTTHPLRVVRNKPEEERSPTRSPGINRKNPSSQRMCVVTSPITYKST